MARITIEGGGAFDCDDGDTLARAGQRAGLGMPYACNVGSCGTCRLQLIEGEVVHLRDDAPAWTERDRKRGRWLGCQAQPRTDCLIKVRLDPACEPVHPPVRMTGEFIGASDLTHDMREFAFALDGPDAFRPGQYALLSLPDVSGARAYSMCNLPGEGIWRFQIKRVPGGAATRALFDELQPGDRIAIDGAYGAAYLREGSPRNLLLIAGGSGLSPMISIARAAAENPAFDNRQIHFLYGGRAVRDVCGEAILAELSGFGQRLFYLPALSEPEPDDAWSGATGFLHDVARKRFGERLCDFEIYFAGPPLMAQALQTMLHQAGVPPQQIHFDEFY